MHLENKPGLCSKVVVHLEGWKAVKGWQSGLVLQGKHQRHIPATNRLDTGW